MLSRRSLLRAMSSFVLLPNFQDGTSVAVATFTGDLVTDAVRVLGNEGDGRDVPDSSVGIYPARRNMLPNGGFEEDTRYWTVNVGRIDRQTEHVAFGEYGGRATVTSVVADLIISQFAVLDEATLPQVPHTFRVSLWAPESAAGKTVLVYMMESASDILGATTTNTTLVAGDNDLRVTATPTESGRTLLECRIQIKDLAVDDYVDIDGAACWESGYAFPYVEASEVLVPYAPSPDLFPNGDFEDVTLGGWFSPDDALSLSATHVRNGTQAMKIIANGASAHAQAFLSDVFTGTPLPQVEYAVGRWMYAPDTVVGNLAHIALVEEGGASGQNVITFPSQSLAEGWNYQLVSGTPEYADSTAIEVQIQIDDVDAGDTVWVDDIRGGDNYVAPTPATVSRDAGRIQIPMTGMSARRGWVALSVRPAWYSAIQPQFGRPTMPVTLWRWADDADNGLWLTFDGGLLTMTRTADGVSDAASVPWRPARDEPSVVAATWDENGVLVSADGRPFVGAFESFVSDEFDRSDGLLGSPWHTAGESAPRIVGGRLEPGTGAGHGYAHRDLGEIPARFGGSVSYAAGTGGEDFNTHTLATTDALGSLDDLMHVFLDRDNATYQWRDDGVFGFGVGVTFDTPIPNDGTPVETWMTFQGDTLALRVWNESYSFQHESIARLATQTVFWEVGRHSENGGYSRWDRVEAFRWAAPDGPGNIPTLTSTTADIGSNGDDTGIFGGDVLWVAMGRGALTDTDVTALAALDADPDARSVPSSVALPNLVWPADTSALWTYAAAGSSSSAELARASSAMAAITRASSSSAALARASSTTTEIT